MKKNKSRSQFWTMLGAVNFLAVLYPIRLLHLAEGPDDRLFAAFAFIGVVFLLLIVDAVLVVLAEALGSITA